MASAARSHTIRDDSVLFHQADLFAGAIFIEQSIGWNVWGSIIALLVLSMIFTVGGKKILPFTLSPSTASLNYDSLVFCTFQVLSISCHICIWYLLSGNWQVVVKWWSNVFLLLAGGLSAVIWTDFVQVFIMIIGAFVLMGISK